LKVSTVWESAWALVQFTISAALVIALVYGAARVAARFRGRPTGQNLRVLEAVSLGGNRMICAVRAVDKVLIIGVTDKGVELLDVITDVSAWDAEGSAGGDGPTSWLGRWRDSS